MYRKLWLINAKGNRYDFQTESSKIFLASPNGFGFTKKLSVTQLGNTEVVDSNDVSNGNITGELEFYDPNGANNYQEYQNFIQFVKYKPLELHYLTPNNIEDYYCDVVLTTTTKDQMDANGVLRIGLTFHRLTQWLTSTDYVVELSNESSGTGKYYDLIRPYHYSGTTLQNVAITNNGTNDVGFVFEIQGDVTNPQFSISQDSVVYGSCKLTGTFDYVKVNSVDDEEQIYLENDGSVLANPTSYQDLTTGSGVKTFVKLKVGENIFDFTCSNIDTFSGTIKIRFKASYVSC